MGSQKYLLHRGNLSDPNGWLRNLMVCARHFSLIHTFDRVYRIGVAPKFVDLTPEAMVKLNLAITTYMMDLGIDGYYLYPADNDTHDLLQPAPLYIVLMKAVLEKVYFRIYGKLQLPSHKAKVK